MRRSAFTLLEVIIALAILVGAHGGLGRAGAPRLDQCRTGPRPEPSHLDLRRRRWPKSWRGHGRRRRAAGISASPVETESIRRAVGFTASRWAIRRRPNCWRFASRCSERSKTGPRRPVSTSLIAGCARSSRHRRRDTSSTAASNVRPHGTASTSSGGLVRRLQPMQIDRAAASASRLLEVVLALSLTRGRDGDPGHGEFTCTSARWTTRAGDDRARSARPHAVAADRRRRSLGRPPRTVRRRRFAIADGKRLRGRARRSPAPRWQAQPAVNPAPARPARGGRVALAPPEPPRPRKGPPTSRVVRPLSASRRHEETTAAAAGTPAAIAGLVRHTVRAADRRRAHSAARRVRRGHDRWRAAAQRREDRCTTSSPAR